MVSSDGPEQGTYAAQAEPASCGPLHGLFQRESADDTTCEPCLALLSSNWHSDHTYGMMVQTSEEDTGESNESSNSTSNSNTGTTESDPPQDDWANGNEPWTGGRKREHGIRDDHDYGEQAGEQYQPAPEVFVGETGTVGMMERHTKAQVKYAADVARAAEILQPQEEARLYMALPSRLEDNAGRLRKLTRTIAIDVRNSVGRCLASSRISQAESAG